jgi:hypothetical protein
MAIILHSSAQLRQATAGSAAEVLAPAQVQAFLDAAGTCG